MNFPIECNRFWDWFHDFCKVSSDFKSIVCFHVTSRIRLILLAAMLVEFRSNMAASQAQPQVNNESESGIIHEIPLPDYAKSLEGVVTKRYILTKYRLLEWILF